MRNPEWNNMKNEFPEMPQDIKDMIQREVSAQIKKDDSVETIDNLRNKKASNDANNSKIRKNSYSVAKVAGFALAAVLAVGGTSYAATKLYKMSVDKIGNFGAEISVSTEEGTTNNSEGTVTIPEIALELVNLPEGFVPMQGYQMLNTEGTTFNESKIIISKENYDLSEESARLFVYSLPKGYENFSVHDKNVKSSEEFKLSNGFATYMEYEVVKNSGDEMQLTSKIYAVYPEFNHMIEIAGFNNISKEALEAIANAINITEASLKNENFKTDATRFESEDDLVYVYNEVSDADISSEKDAYKAWVEKYGTVDKAEFESALHKIGDEVRYSYDAYGVEYLDENGNFGIKITDVKVSDNIDGTVSSIYNQGLDNNIDENGKLIPEKLQYVKCGDGIDAVDEVIKTETKDMKFVLVTMEYTNYSGSDCYEFLFDPGFMIRAKDNGDTLTAYNNNTNLEVGIDKVVGEYYSDSGLPDYWYNGVDGNQKNYIMNFKEGETRTVYAGFFVAEEDLPNMYLEILRPVSDNEVFGYYINANDLTEVVCATLEVGFFDIRQ